MDRWACHSKKSEKLMEDPTAGARSLENTDFMDFSSEKTASIGKKGLGYRRR